MRIYGLLLAAVLPLAAGPLTQGERDYALSQLQATRKMVLDTVAGLSAAQWKYKPSGGGWSIAEIADHILLSEGFMMTELKKQLDTPAVAPRFGNSDDVKVYASMLDRSNKAKAPQALQPAANAPSQAELAKKFAAARDRTIDYVLKTQDDLRSHISGTGDHAYDAYQWVLAIAAHTERHMAQIKEVMASPGFPKK